MPIKSQSYDYWGMELLLVFFPESNSSSAAAINLDKSSSLGNSTSIGGRTNPNNPILTKTQSTISICVLLLFLTLLLFTLSTFEPTSPKTPRRFLPERLPVNTRRRSVLSERNFSWFSGGYWSSNATRITEFAQSHALQGMGKLYSRGTRAMNDLVVGHVVEDTTEDEFKLFFRLLYRSGITAKADIVFIFDSSSSAARFEPLIREENDSFLKLVRLYRKLNRTSHDDSVSAVRFDVTQFVKNVKKEMREPLWGKNIRFDNNVTRKEQIEAKSNRLSYGSVVGFEVSELDPENSLSGFLDHVPLSLRRWACYPMLLGRVRRNFKHVMLVSVKKLLLLSKPLGRVRAQHPKSVYIFNGASQHEKKKTGKSEVNSAILLGGTRGIRKLSSAMLIEIVRVAMQHKKKSSINGSRILSEMVGNGHILKNVEVVSSNESITEVSSKSELNRHIIIQRDNENFDINSVIMKQICSCEVDSSVYKECFN